MIFSGKLKNADEWGYCEVLNVWKNPPIGTKIGNFIYYKDTCCEILDTKKGKYNLCSWGWVNKKDCSFRRSFGKVI